MEREGGGFAEMRYLVVWIRAQAARGLHLAISGGGGAVGLTSPPPCEVTRAGGVMRAPGAVAPP